MNHDLPGYQIPFFQSLTERPTMGGIPRAMAVSQLTMWCGFTFLTHLVLIGIVGGVATWVLSAFLAKVDPYFVEIFNRYWQHAHYWEP